MKTLLIVLLAAATECLAATTIEVSAKFADIPPGVIAPNKPESLATTKGIIVYSAPRVTTLPSQAATIEVTEKVAAPDGSVVPLGITLTVTPSITEKGNIAFKGKTTDRGRQAQKEDESLSVLGFVVREVYFKGVVTSGSTVLLRGGNTTSAAAKAGTSAPTAGRESVIYLTFKKVTPETTTKKPVTPVKSTKSSGTKSSSTKKKSSKP
jgi:hypothetical protein